MDVAKTDLEKIYIHVKMIFKMITIVIYILYLKKLLMH